MADFEAIFELDDSDKIDCIFDINATVYNYEELDKLPKINGETLIGNKTSEELHLASAEGLAGLSSALDFEIQARETADVNINNRIDVIVESFDDDVERLEQNIQNEATTRAENDTLLQNNINTLDEKVDGINVNLTAQIDNLEQDVNTKYNELFNDIDEEIQAREQADITINQRITDVADELNQTIEENVVALQQEDTALQNQINAHSQTLTAYDTRITNNTNAITQEIADRQAGDNTLQEQVNDNKNLIDTKQDIISDLSTIRSNAQAGYDIIPQVESNTQRIEDLTVARFPNAIIVGTPHIEGGQVSGFSDSNYLQFPFVDISRGLPFDIYFSFTTSSDVNTQQNILDAYFGIALAIQNGKGIMALSSNGTSWDIGMATGTNTLLPNTTYFVKYSWTGTAYSAALSTDDQTYIPDMNLTSSLSPYKTTIFIGGSPNLFGAGSAHPFKGTINFNKSKVVVNGITVWEGMADVGLASRANVSLTNLDEVGENRFNEKQNVTDNNLVTLDKTVVGAVNELDAKIKDIQLFKFPDATIIGTPTINNGQVTNFSSNNYLILPFAFDTKDRAFEINMAFTTGSNVSTTQNLLGGNYCLALLIEGSKLVFRASNNGTSWNVADITTTLTLQANTNYFVRIYFDKLSYKVSYSTNGEDYTQVGYKVTTETPRHGQVFIGVGNNQHNPFLGIINLNKCNIKLNTSIIWQGMDDAGLATRADISLSNLDEIGEKRFTDLQNALDDKVSFTDYASADTAGVIKTSNTYNTTINSDGLLMCMINSANTYPTKSNYTFISKGTLENIKEALVTSVGDTKYQPTGDYATNTALTDGLATKQNTISDLATIRDGASKGATAYQKPSTGIPKTDLASAVQTSLGKADTALQSVPSNYVTDTQLATKQDKLTPGSAIGIDNNEVAVKLFDKSKFTVVGSPTITNDGIASGFNSSNYLIAPEFTIGSSLDLYLRCTYPSSITTTSNMIIGGNANSYGGIQLGISDTTGKTYISLRSTNAGGQDFDIIKSFTIDTFQLGATYDFHLQWTGAKYMLYYKKIGDASWTKKDIVNSNLKIITQGLYNRINIGNAVSYWNLQRPFQGSIDLSQFSITVDGQEVFNGTQTIYQALDNKSPLIYNAQAFNVVGSPTITDDGVASGFSPSSYLRKSNIDFASANSWKITTPIHYITNNTANGVYQMFNGGYNNDLYINASGYIKFNIKAGISGATTLSFSTQVNATGYNAIALINGNDYIHTLEFTGTQYIFNLYKDGSLIYSDIKNSTDKIYPSSSNGINIGTSSYDGSMSTGSIDLKQFSITVDGVEVFSGALKGTKQLTTAGFPSDKSLALTIGASGAEYTAPADGYIYVGWYATAAGGWVVPYNATIHMDGTVTRSAQGGDVWWYRATVQASQGDKVIISYDAAHIDFIVFVYAKGAK